MHPSYPKAPLREQLTEIIRELFAKLGKESMGTRLFHIFIEAGLCSPDCRVEYPITGGPESPYYEFLAESFRTLLPTIEAVGVVAAGSINVDTLEDRLRAEALENKSAYPVPAMVGGFAFQPS
jgi:hypothetical protein